MNKNEKAEVVSQIREDLQNSNAVYLVDYSGINVSQINDIRRQFIKEGVKYKVYKNTLFQKAIEAEGGYEELNNLMEGMTGFAFASGDTYVAPAKIIKKFNDDTKKFSLKGCYIENTYYPGEKLEVLAKMPTKDEVMASIVGSIAAPASGIVGAVSAVMRDLVSVVDQIGKQKAA